MKRPIVLTLALALGLTFAFGQDANIDNKKSSVKWVGTKVTGEHSGVIDIKEGSISLKDHALLAVNITIDMTTIKCTDLEGEMAAKLEGHLNSEDFFNTAEHTSATFKSTAVTAGLAGYSVTGELTIKGKTETVTFNASADMHGQVVHATGTLTFDRTKFGIKYSSGSFFDDLGDKMISDDVALTFNIVTTVK